MGIVFLLSAAILWGMIGPISKIIFAQGISPLETAFWRGTLAGAAFFIHWLFKRYELPRNPRQFIGIVLFGIFGVALLEGSYVYAVHFGGAALASVLLYSAPVWVNLASLLIFKETIPQKRWVALSITMLGVLGVCLWGAKATFSGPAIMWGLLSGLSYAAFYLAGKIYFHRTNPVVVYMIAFPVGSFAIWPIMSYLSDMTMIESVTHITRFPPATLGAFLALGIVCTYLPYWLYSKGLKVVEAGRAAIITMVEPVVSVSLAALIFGELFTTAGYCFAALVILGVAIS